MNGKNAQTLLHIHLTDLDDDLTKEGIKTVTDLDRKLIDSPNLRSKVMVKLAAITDCADATSETFKKQHNQIDWQAINYAKNITVHAYSIVTERDLAELVLEQLLPLKQLLDTLEASCCKGYNAVI